MYRVANQKQFQTLINEAQLSPRLRKNLNLHNEQDKVQRFFNALIPGTYVQPHKHEFPIKTETMILLEGSMVVVIFDEKGKVINKITLSKKSQNIGLDIDPDVWHSVYALEPTVYFECKLGPYNPISDKDFASWAPKENQPEVAQYLKKLMET